MKKLKEFIRKLDCHASLAMTFGRKARSLAFTMAEILLSLTIIGIVAAITLPSLTANFQDKAFNTKRQALHARLSQAFRMMDYSEYMPIDKSYTDESDPDNPKFVRPNVNKFMDDLGKSLSLKRISDPDMIFSNFHEESFASKFDSMVNGGYGILADSSTVDDLYFQTANGESIRMFLMNPNTSDKNELFQSLCFILLYDLNGKKGPNKFGKDIGFMSAFYYDHIELYASMLGAITGNMENDDCDSSDPSCQKYKYPDLILPSPEELVNALLAPEAGNISGSFCSSDGHAYAKFNEFEHQEDNNGCLYALITNDGNTPKNGIIIEGEY